MFLFFIPWHKSASGGREKLDGQPWEKRQLGTPSDCASASSVSFYQCCVHPTLMSVLLLGNLAQQRSLLCTRFLMGSSIRLLWWASLVTVCWMFASLWLNGSIFLLLFGLSFGSLILLCPSFYWELQVTAFNRSSQLFLLGVWGSDLMLFFLFVCLCVCLCVNPSIHLFLLFFPLLWLAINVINLLIWNPNTPIVDHPLDCSE